MPREMSGVADAGHRWRRQTAVPLPLSLLFGLHGLPAMNLPQLLENLFDNGRVVVGSAAGEIAEADRQLACRVLAEAERAGRLEFPGRAPAWDEASGLWGAEMFFWACHFAVQRDAGADQLGAALSAACPAGAPLVSRHYSVDLVFRFLPDLHTLGREASPADPLVEILERWGAEWPLSSVGMKGVAAPQVEPLLSEPVLLRYYAERIIARRDRARLAEPRVAEEVRAQLGMHHTLAPEIWAALA